MNRSRHRLSFQPIFKFMAASSLVLATGLCLAGDIYRWVDEQGKTHLADAVPERYKAKATRIDSQRFEVSQGDRQAAVARAAKERERQAALDAERARAEAGQRQGFAPGAGASPPAAKPGKNSGSECDRLWQEYFKSQECFAPYLTVRGGVKAEAFEHCKEVVSPDRQCGQAKKIGAD